MATYAELYDLRSNSALRNRIVVAVLVAAETIRGELDTVPNHANRLAWSKMAFEHPEAEADRMFPAVLAANRAATVAVITGATDAAIQTAVDAAVNLFAVAP